MQTLRKVRLNALGVSSVHKVFVAFGSNVSGAFAMQYVKVGIVGGSDLVKISEQLGANSRLSSAPVS